MFKKHKCILQVVLDPSLEKAKAEHEEIEKLYQKYNPDYHSTSKCLGAPPRFVKMETLR